MPLDPSAPPGMTDVLSAKPAQLLADEARGWGWPDASRDASPARTATSAGKSGDEEPELDDSEPLATPLSPRRSLPPTTQAASHRSDPFDPNLVSFRLGDPENPLNFPMRRKLLIITVMLLQQLWIVSLGTIYAPTAPYIAEAFGVGGLVSRLPLATYLLGFSAGPIFLTSAAEDYGRKPIFTVCLILVYLLQIPCALAPNLAALIVCRFLAGVLASPIFNAVACLPDLFDTRDPAAGWFLNIWAFTAETATIGSLIGAWITVKQDWRWVFGVAGLVGAGLTALYVVLVPETRAGPILVKRARRLRKSTGNAELYAEHEIIGRRSLRAMFEETLLRPLNMLFREPIVYVLAIWDGLNYGIIYLAIEAAALVYTPYGFTVVTANVALQALIIGYLIAIATYPLARRAEERISRERGGDCPEAKLWWAKFGGVIFAGSLFLFAATSRPPVPWIICTIALALFGVSSHILFLVVSDYTVESYGHYAASAVTGQSFAREIMAASLALVGETFYKNFGSIGPSYFWPTMIIALISLPMAAIPWVFDRYGPAIRARSHFALAIKSAREQAERAEKNEKARLEEPDAQHGRPS